MADEFFATIWDDLSKHTYATGIDRGVFYPENANGVPWNGLSGVDELAGDSAVETYYIDGERFYNHRPVKDASASIRAYTYPDEFLPYDGLSEAVDGIFLDEQPHAGVFGVCYRTLVGSVLTADLGYKLHLWYNLTAEPTQYSYATLSSQAQLSTFSWTVRGVPLQIEGYRPTNHIVIDSRKIPDYHLARLEAILYGTNGENYDGGTPETTYTGTLDGGTHADNGEDVVDGNHTFAPRLPSIEELLVWPGEGISLLIEEPLVP